jgi:hypothetical protein
MGSQIEGDVVTQGDPANVNEPTWIIEATVTDDVDGHIIADFTGANRIQFPRDFARLSQEQQSLFIHKNRYDIINALAGTATL